jgi:hypothetical protein
MIFCAEQSFPNAVAGECRSRACMRVRSFVL